MAPMMTTMGPAQRRLHLEAENFTHPWTILNGKVTAINGAAPKSRTAKVETQLDQVGPSTEGRWLQVLEKLAPQVGLEPTTLRLTVVRLPGFRVHPLITKIYYQLLSTQ
jgi:hypothetical protein